MSIELQCGGLHAWAEPLGGELVRVQRGGRDYLWDGDPSYWPGRNPILFPTVGNLKDDCVSIGEKRFHMARHGFARRSVFDVAERGENFVVFALRESSETLAQYPFPFSLRVTHCLREDGFSTRFQVRNPGEVPMPFCIGAHTAFRCPLTAEERFEDYRLVFDRPETADSLLLSSRGLLLEGQTRRFLSGEDTLPLRYEDFAQLDTLIFQNLRSTAVCLRSSRTGRGVRMEFDGFPLIAFWTKADLCAPFLCLEPWHGCAALEEEDGQFVHKPHCIQLEPGKEKTLEYRVTLLEG